MESELLKISILIICVLIIAIVIINHHRLKMSQNRDLGEKWAVRTYESSPQYTPSRTYRAMALDNLHKISFFRRDTPTESTIYIGAKGWNLEKCIQEGYIVYANTDNREMTIFAEQKEVDDYLTALMMDMLISDLSIKLRLQAAGLQDTSVIDGQIVDNWEREGTPVDESLLYTSKKK